MALKPSPEPLLTVVPPEVATVNDLQCEQLAVDPTPTAGVLGDTMAPVLPLDKGESGLIVSVFHFVYADCMQMVIYTRLIQLIRVLSEHDYISVS